MLLPHPKKTNTKKTKLKTEKQVQKENHWDKKNSKTKPKDQWSLLCVGKYFRAWGLPWSMGINLVTLLRPDKVDLLFAGVWGTSVSKSFLVMGRALCSLSLPSAWICLVWTCAGLCLLSQSLSRRCCLFGVIDRPQLFQSFCLLFHVHPWAWKGGSFEKPIGWLPEMETIPDVAKVAKNLRWDRLWALEELTTIILLKEYSNEWLWMTSCYTQRAKSLSTFIKETSWVAGN